MCRICAACACRYFSGFDLAVFFCPFESVLSASASVRQRNCIFSRLRSIVVKCQRIAFVHRVDKLTAACPISFLYFHLPLTVAWVFYVFSFKSLCFKSLCISVYREFKSIVFRIHLFFKLYFNRMAICRHIIKCIRIYRANRVAVYDNIFYRIIFIRYKLERMARAFFYCHFRTCNAFNLTMLSCCRRNLICCSRNFFRCDNKLVNIRRRTCICSKH